MPRNDRRAEESLFGTDTAVNSGGPLADRMRPRVLDDVIGQDHIVGPGRLLRRAIQADRLSSLIFYGPPGTGKTSLARVIANTTLSSFESLNAVLSGIKDIREAIDRSDERRRLYGKRTILFVDEVHRWNKAQQDALLPWVENGTVILIGATTENPFFEVNRALVSRSRIFQLKALEEQDLMTVARRTLQDSERGYGRWKIIFEEGALEHLVSVSGGDTRSLLNALELAIETSPASWPPPEGSEIQVSFSDAEESIQRKAVLYDRDGDYHFDTISAFIKSIRGSDPDAALYWLAKMVRAGEDPAFIFRRMIISASEDIGLADPQALGVVTACAQAFDRIGFPEGNFPLSQAALYLATAPKSNTTMSFFDALSEVEKEDAEVPAHLKDANRDKEGFGHGEGYIYPHAYRDHWAAQQYLPGSLRGRTFYIPSRQGYEGSIRDDVLRKRELQAAAVLGDSDENGSETAEILSWSASSRGREAWYKRLQSGRSGSLLADREAIFSQIQVARHERILIPAADDGLLLWEALRKTPEGLSAALVRTEQARGNLLHYVQALDESEKPLIAVMQEGLLPPAETALELFQTDCFDYILAREVFKRGFGALKPDEAFRKFAEKAKALLGTKGSLVLLQSAPVLGQRISDLLEREKLGNKQLVSRLAEAEQAFFSENNGKKAWTWDQNMPENVLKELGFRTNFSLCSKEENRVLTERDIGNWVNTQDSPWGKHMSEELGITMFEELKALLCSRAGEGPVLWKWKQVKLYATPL